MGLGPVRQVALAYTEPMTEGGADFFEEAQLPLGFRMGFHAKIVDVDLDPAIIPPLLRKARKIHDASNPPEGTPGCEDCSNFETLMLASKTWK